MARLSYLELPVKDTASKAFYADAFGWSFSDFGPTYTATTTGDVDIGLQADREEKTASPLPVIQVDDLDAALASIERAGGRITRAIFGFPGGRRFHFADLDGHELAAMQPG